MTFTKSILLGSAAALAAVSAQAADLPSKKAAPAQYVKICDAAGAGYFYIPGSDTCLKISGYAELDFVSRTIKDTRTDAWIEGVTDAHTRNNNTFSTDTEVQLDAVTKTSYGDVHTYLAYEITTPANTGYIDNAYFEFAGLTAGKHESFFHNIGGLYSGYLTPDYSTNLLAYTASFGGGFSATLSVEDPTVSRASQTWNSDAEAQNEYTGSRTPDVVGALRVKQGWGEASIIGGYHQTNYHDDWNGGGYQSVAGYALAGFIKFNLPMLAAGDSIAFQATYERNALKMGGLTNVTNNNGYSSALIDVPFQGAHNSGYTLLADLVHNWTPTVSTEIEASYGSVKYSDSYGYFNNSSMYIDNVNSWNMLSIGQVTKWKPVKGLEFGIDTAYTRYHNSFNAYQVNESATGANNSDFRVQFRAIRSF